MEKMKFSDIDWVSKLSSRKFWGYIIGMVVAICLLAQADGNTMQLVLGVVTAVADTAVYTFGEAIVDSANRKADAQLKIAMLSKEGEQ